LESVGGNGVRHKRRPRHRWRGLLYQLSASVTILAGLLGLLTRPLPAALLLTGLLGITLLLLLTRLLTRLLLARTLRILIVHLGVLRNSRP
jgi:hypothetical protein